MNLMRGHQIVDLVVNEILQLRITRHRKIEGEMVIIELAEYHHGWKRRVVWETTRVFAHRKRNHEGRGFKIELTAFVH
jgi:hypothetical protein